MQATNTAKPVISWALFKRVVSFAAPYKRTFYLSILFAILMSIMAPVRPYLIQATIDKAMGKLNVLPMWLMNWIPAEWLADAAQFILMLTVFQLLFIGMETAVRFGFSFLTAWLGQHVVNDMRIAVYQKIIHLNLRQFDTTPIGTLTTRSINDIESIQEIFSDGLIPIIADILVIVVTLVTMFWIDWRLTFIALIPFPLMLVATYYFKESVNRSFTSVRNAVSQLNAFVQEHLTGMQVVQVFAAEGREHKKFEKINSEHRDANIRAIFAYSVFFPIVEVVLAVSMGLMVWWVANQALQVQGSPAIDFSGKLVAFILYMNQLFRPLRVIADKFNVLQMGMIAAERVFKVLDNEDFLKDKGSFIPEKVKGSISFERVHFAYTADKQVLNDISFQVQPGETVALVGHTGSGKSSIISLLNRLYEISEGSIKVDGIDIKEYSIPALRNQMGIVLQDVFLFSGSILDNITLRDPNISRGQVIAAAKLIGVHEFIMRLPGNYDYDVMERGHTLSLGQRQIISFIRALLYDPAILILDEATSSIDTESELLIQQAIEKLIAGRTSIVIAHRLSTIRKANKIIVLDAGRIVEMGNHDQLINNRGHYAKLYEMQLQAEEN
jgi:ATP-binding cassette subfamily B protein